MALLAMLLMAAPSTGRDPEPLIAGAEHFDLAAPAPGRPCDARSGSEIVVCGRRKNDEPVIRDPGRFARRPLRAEVKLPSGATLDLHAEQHGSPDGRSGPAAMIRVRIPF
jgi:hypothetical protein